MSDNMIGGMQDIGSMSMGGPTHGDGRKERQKKPAVKLGDAGLLIAAGVAAVLLIVVMIVAIAGAVERNKVKAVVDDYFEFFEAILQGVNYDDLLDYYEEHYPEELYKAAKDELEDEYDAGDWGDDIEDIDIIGEVLSITKIKDSESMDMIRDGVEDFFDQADVRIRAKDIDISKAYLVLSRMEADGDSFFMIISVVKVNGKYGIYGTQVLDMSM